jgi:hypothetical protein
VTWARGRDDILDMLDQGDLGQVVADSGLARRLIDAAHRHVKSAETLAEDDPDLAYAAIHDAIRKAMTAMLQIQGLRATTSGGHLAVQRAARAQFGASMGVLLRPVDRIRTTRRAIEYPDRETSMDADAVRADIPVATALVNAADQAIEHLTVLIR